MQGRLPDRQSWSPSRVVGTLALGLLAALAGPRGATAKSGQVSVLDGTSTSDYRFSPSSLTIDVGDEVVWMNEGGEEHTVTFQGGEFDSHPNCRGGLVVLNCMKPGTSVRHRLSHEGEFPYSCKLHPGMRGVVEVRPAGSVTAGSPTMDSARTSAADPPSVEAPPATMAPRGLTTSSVPGSSTSSTSPPTMRQMGEAPVFQLEAADAPLVDEWDAAAPAPASVPVAKRSGGIARGAVPVLLGALATVSLGGGYVFVRIRKLRSRARSLS